MNEFDPLDLGIIVGGVRNFKTAHLVRLISVAYEQGYKIYTNLNLKGLEYVKLNSDDKKGFVDELRRVFVGIRSEGTFNEKKFLAIDELKSIINSQNWDRLVGTSDIWTQLGKMGFTTYGTSQAFSMVYNHYRENSNKQIVTKRIGTDSYSVSVYQQNSSDHTKYDILGRYAVDARIVYSTFDTHQLMYWEKR